MRIQVQELKKRERDASTALMMLEEQGQAKRACLADKDATGDYVPALLRAHPLKESIIVCVFNDKGVFVKAMLIFNIKRRLLFGGCTQPAVTDMLVYEVEDWEYLKSLPQNMLHEAPVFGPLYKQHHYDMGMGLHAVYELANMYCDVGVMCVNSIWMKF